MKRIVHNLITGERAEVDLTTEEIADAVARTAREAPVIAQAAADSAAKDSAKLDPVIQYLVSHTPDECAKYVQDNVVDLPSAKAFLKNVAKALSVLARRELR